MKSVERNRLKDLLRDTITLLCKNGLSYKESFSIEALIGITLDDSHVFLVNINEYVQTEFHTSDRANDEMLSDGDISNASIVQDGSPSMIRKVTSGKKRHPERSNEADFDGPFSPKKKAPNAKKDKAHPPDHVEDSSDEDLLFVKEEIGSLSPIENPYLGPNNNDSAQQTYRQETSTDVTGAATELSFSSWTVPLPHDNHMNVKKRHPSGNLTISNNLWTKPQGLVSPDFKILPSNAHAEGIIQRPKRVFSCHIPECQQQFFTKRNLTGHLWKKHQIGEPTICKCGQVFGYKNKFYVHRKSCPDAQVFMSNGWSNNSIDATTNEDFTNGKESHLLETISSLTADESVVEDPNVSTSAEVSEIGQTVFHISNTRSLKDREKELEEEENQYMSLETL